MTIQSVFGKATGAYDRFSKLVTPKGHHRNTITQDTEILHAGGHPETRTGTCALQTDTQTDPNAEKTHTHTHRHT